MHTCTEYVSKRSSKATCEEQVTLTCIRGLPTICMVEWERSFLTTDGAQISWWRVQRLGVRICGRDSPSPMQNEGLQYRWSLSDLVIGAR